MKLAQGYIGLTDGYPDWTDAIEQDFLLKMFMEAVDGLISTTSHRNGQRDVFKTIRTDYLEGDPQIKKDFDKLVCPSHFHIRIHAVYVSPLNILDKGSMHQPSDFHAGRCPFQSSI